MKWPSFLCENGHRVTVVASSRDYLSGKLKAKSELPSGLVLKEITVFGGHNKGVLSRALAFLYFSIRCFWVSLRVPKVDVVWSTSPPLFQCVTAWVVAKMKRVPFVMEVRDLWLDFAVQLGVVRKGPVYWICKRIERFLYRFCDELIVNSPGFVPYIQSVVPGQTIHLFPNGVIPEDFEDVNAEKMAEFQSQVGADGKFLVVYAGNMGKANDIECLLDSAAMLQVSHPNIRFVLMGGGMYVSTFKARCRTDGLKNVVFCDPVPKTEMPHFLALASVCIASLKDIPLFATVYPNKVFDYMAAGKPTILSIGGPIKDVILESGGGVFVEPGNAQALGKAIVTYYDDQNRVIHDGERARSYVKQHFHREDIATALAGFFVGLKSR